MTRSVLINARKVLLVTAAGFALGAQAQTSTTTPSANPSHPQATTPSPNLDLAAKAQAAFRRADTNKDGKLSREEAARLPAIAAKFDELDTDKDGSLSLTEFMQGFSSDK